MEVRLLEKGYKNNEVFYQDFLDDKINQKDEYFSNEIVYIKEAPDFPIYMGRGSEEYKKQGFLQAFRTIADSYLEVERDVLLEERFWHSLLVTYKREYILDHHPEVEESMSKFRNIVLKNFDWENYIYKCILGAQYINDHVSEQERERYYELIADNLDIYNYIIKYEIFRNDVFLINILDIIDELNLSKMMKAKIKRREDLGDDERYGRRVIFEFNKRYPIVMAPMLEKEELKEFFITYLGYYYDVNQALSKEEIPSVEKEYIPEDSPKEIETGEPVIVSNYRYKQSQFNTYNVEKERVAETEVSVAVKEGPPKKEEQNELLDYLEKHNLEYIDQRAQGGSLWVIGGRNIEPYLKPLEEEGIRFRFKAVGGRASKGRPAWFWYN